MKGIFASASSLAVAILMSLPVLHFSSFPSSAQVEFGCEVVTVLSAPGAGDRDFLFLGETTTGDEFAFTLADGEGEGGTIGEGGGISIFLAPAGEWVFGGVECDAPGGLIVANFEDGFSIECDNAKLGSGSCTISLLHSSVTNVPTMSEWGMISAAAGLMIVGVWFAVRRRKEHII